jgi:hypothetical protein
MSTGVDRSRTRPRSTLTTIAWRALIAVVVFDAASAVGGGLAMLLTDGFGMPRSMLQGSPFDSFRWPALILLVVVGGTHLLAALLLRRSRGQALLWSAFAGFVLMIWILVEIVVIRGFGALQAIYFGAGLAEVALVLALLGIVSWLPPVQLSPRAGSSR